MCILWVFFFETCNRHFGKCSLQFALWNLYVAQICLHIKCNFHFALCVPFHSEKKKLASCFHASVQIERRHCRKKEGKLDTTQGVTVDCRVGLFCGVSRRVKLFVAMHMFTLLVNIFHRQHRRNMVYLPSVS